MAWFGRKLRDTVLVVIVGASHLIGVYSGSLHRNLFNDKHEAVAFAQNKDQAVRLVKEEEERMRKQGFIVKKENVHPVVLARKTINFRVSHHVPYNYSRVFDNSELNEEGKNTLMRLNQELREKIVRDVVNDIPSEFRHTLRVQTDGAFSEDRIRQAYKDALRIVHGSVNVKLTGYTCHMGGSEHGQNEKLSLLRATHAVGFVVNTIEQVFAQELGAKISVHTMPQGRGINMNKQFKPLVLLVVSELNKFSNQTMLKLDGNKVWSKNPQSMQKFDTALRWLYNHNRGEYDKLRHLLNPLRYVDIEYETQLVVEIDGYRYDLILDKSFSGDEHMKVDDPSFVQKQIVQGIRPDPNPHGGSEGIGGSKRSINLPPDRTTSSNNTNRILRERMIASSRGIDRRGYSGPNIPRHEAGRGAPKSGRSLGTKKQGGRF